MDMTKSPKQQIPLYKPWIGDKEREYVLDCIDSSWISSKGKYVEKFEKKFAGFIGSSYAASVCNGTAALHLALLALGISEGDEVIVPTFTYIASVNAIKYVGATPVFCEADRVTWQLDAEEAEAKITNKTKAIVAVHLYGQPCDMEKLVSIANKHQLFLVEDCAEAIGSQYKDVKVGTFGIVSAFSFYGNKTITTGEGGMVATSDPDIYRRVNKFKGQGLSGTREYWHDVIGYNYRMTNICAAIGLAQLERVEEILKKKRIIAERYAKNLKGLPIEFHRQIGPVTHSYWICSLLTMNTQMCNIVREYLASHNIETRPLFPPIHLMPMYKGAQGDFPISEDISSRGFNLPSYPQLPLESVDHITQLISDVMK